jgi:hypothetical protein
MKHRMVGDANQESYLIDESDCCGVKALHLIRFTVDMVLHIQWMSHHE